MGYEVKLIIGDPCHYTDCEDGHYFMVAAKIDLCKPGYDSHILSALRKATEKFYYYYADDGETKITEDLYGERPALHSLDEIIEALKKDVERDDYRRFKWALSLLESIKRNDGDEMKVLWCGH